MSLKFMGISVQDWVASTFAKLAADYLLGLRDTPQCTRCRQDLLIKRHSIHFCPCCHRRFNVSGPPPYRVEELPTL